MVHLSPYLKPKLGEPCNGCGFCCAVEPCLIAKEFLGAGNAGPCPALEVAPDKSLRCGMISRPITYLLAMHSKSFQGNCPAQAYQEETALLVREALGAGQGCDAEDGDHSVGWPWAVNINNMLEIL